MKILYWDSYDIGMATLAVGLFFFSAVQIMFAGIAGEYIGEILSRMSDKPLVVEKERLNFEEDDREEA